MISLREAQAMNRKGNVIPLAVRIPADLDTPVAAFMKLAKSRRDSFLLESIEGGEKLARYSFVGFDPFLTIEADGDELTLIRNRKRQRLDAPPLDFMKELFSFYRPVRLEGLPRFTGGAVGYFSYDTIRWLENIPNENPETIGLPLMRFGLYSTVVAFDHLKQEIVVIGNILHEHGHPGFRKQYAETRNRVKAITAKLSRGLRRSDEKSPGHAKVKSCTSEDEFKRAVRRAKRYIKEGDIFQVVLSQRWEIESQRTALDVYRRLRRINPSPYMFLLKFGDEAIVGASPEMMVRVENGTIETRPIAGTRPRGRNDAEDARLIADLLADPKELAEHTMLLDLGRNDIGRVSIPGSVTISDQMIIEKYSHVLHIVSSVTGAMKRRLSPIDGHFACFPAGTVSGAPKIRAMEIVDELEPLRRGIYAGSIAYIDFWGNLDSCIAIRTVVKKGRSYFVQAGAGIVADSKPLREYQETADKARALVEAIVGDQAK